MGIETCWCGFAARLASALVGIGNKYPRSESNRHWGPFRGPASSLGYGGGFIIRPCNCLTRSSQGPCCRQPFHCNIAVSVVCSDMPLMPGTMACSPRFPAPGHCDVADVGAGEKWRRIDARTGLVFCRREPAEIHFAVPLMAAADLGAVRKRCGRLGRGLAPNSQTGRTGYPPTRQMPPRRHVYSQDSWQANSAVRQCGRTRSRRRFWLHRAAAVRRTIIGTRRVACSARLLSPRNQAEKSPAAVP